MLLNNYQFNRKKDNTNNDLVSKKLIYELPLQGYAITRILNTIDGGKQIKYVEGHG